MIIFEAHRTYRVDRAEIPSGTRFQATSLISDEDGRTWTEVKAGIIEPQGSRVFLAAWTPRGGFLEIYEDGE